MSEGEYEREYEIEPAEVILLLIPEHGEEDDHPYPSGLVPGEWDLVKTLRAVADNPEAVRFIADLLEI